MRLLYRVTNYCCRPGRNPHYEHKLRTAHTWPIFSCQAAQSSSASSNRNIRSTMWNFTASWRHIFFPDHFLAAPSHTLIVFCSTKGTSGGNIRGKHTEIRCRGSEKETCNQDEEETLKFLPDNETSTKRGEERERCLSEILGCERETMKTKDTIHTRLKLLKDEGLLESSLLSTSRLTTLLRCNVDKFDRAFYILCSRNKNREEREKSLSEILECEMETIKTLMEENTYWKKVNLVILKEKIDVIKSMDVPVSLVLENHRTVSYSKDTIHTRLKMLKDEGLLESSLLSTSRLPALLGCSVDQFDRAFQILCSRSGLSEILERETLKTLMEENPYWKNANPVIFREKIGVIKSILGIP